MFSHNLLNLFLSNIYNSIYMVRIHRQNVRSSFLFYTGKIYTGIGILFLQFIIPVGKFSPWDGACEVGHPTIHFRSEDISDKM